MKSTILRLSFFIVSLLMSTTLPAQVELLGRLGIEEITPEIRAMIAAFLKHRFEVTGHVKGTDEFEPTPYSLQGANITLTCIADTTQMGGAAADADGKFSAYIFCRNKLKDLRVRVRISYIGMETFEQVFTPKEDKDVIGEKLVIQLDTVILKSNPVTLAEAEVIGELQKMYQRGDTTFFNAEAYEMPSGSVLLDLVRRLPGLRYESGKLTYMGEDIKEIRLNGDSFFKHDMSIALQNMPHEKLKSLKVYEVPDDTLDVNSDDHLVMDMQTKSAVKNLQFANATAGITETLRNFMAQALGNTYVKGGAQVGLDINTRDLPTSGTPTERSINTGVSASYEQTLGSTHIDGRLIHGYNRTDNRSEGFSQIFMPSFTQRTISEETSSNRGHNYAGHATLNGSIGKQTRWHTDFSITTDDTKSQNDNSNKITDGNGLLVSSTKRQNKDFSNNQNVNWGTRFNYYLDENQKHELGLKTDIGYNHGKSHTYSSTLTRFAQMGDSTLSTNYLISSPSDRYSLNTSFFYNFRFGKKNYLQTRYSVRYENNASDETFHNILSDLSLVGIDSLSYKKKNHTLAHGLAASLVIDNSSINLRTSMSIAPTRLLVDDKNYLFHSRKTYITTIFTPSTELKFKFNDMASSITLKYNGYNSMPSVGMLSVAQRLSDPMNTYVGNSQLKESFQHNAGMEVKYKALLRATFDWSQTNNQVTMLTRIDPLTGARSTTPENINGNWNTRSYLFLTKQMGQISLNAIALHSHANNVSFVQQTGSNTMEKSTTKWDNYNFIFITAFTNANWIISATGTYNIDNRKNDYIANSSSGKAFVSQAQINYTSTNGSWNIGSQFNLQKRFDYELASANTTDCIWTIQAQYKFLKNKQATIGLTWNDILNKNRGFQASMSDTQWSETQTFGKTSYLLFTLAYRLSVFN